MAKHPAKEKPSARPGAPEKGARAQGADLHAPEAGVCIICGSTLNGMPAEPEFPVRAVRRLRSILKMPARHTIACKEHLGEARARRAKFEKKVRDYILGAVAFFAFVLIGGLFFGKLDLSMAGPAFFGAIIISLLPCFYYYPSFGK